MPASACAARRRGSAAAAGSALRAASRRAWSRSQAGAAEARRGRAVKVLQVGTGGWGRNHARILAQTGRLAAVCDADAGRAAEYGGRHAVPHYTSVSDALAAERFGAAIVCTPTSTHVDVASELIDAGKHVMVEKPMTYDPGDGEALAAMAARRSVVLTCGYIERYNPCVASVRGMVASGEHGGLVMAEFHREGRMPPHIRDVGVIYDTAVHDIDTAMWLFGAPPEVVFARAGSIRHEHEDFATVMLGFGGDRAAVISSNWITPARSRTFSAVFTGAVVSGDFISQAVRIETGEETRSPRAAWAEPLSAEIEAFVAAAEGSGPAPLVAPADAIRVTRVAEAALLSSRNGAPVYLDLG